MNIFDLYKKIFDDLPNHGILGRKIFTTLDFMNCYRKRKEVSNWFQLYILCSSLILYLLIRFKYTRKLFENKKIPAKNEGMTIFHPIKSIFFFQSFTAKSSYLEDFSNYFQEEINFNKDDVVIDVGCNIGLFSIPLAIANPEITIFAYEPDQHNFNCVKKSIKINNISSENYQINQLAVYNEKRILNFSIGSTPWAGSISELNFFLKQEYDTWFSSSEEYEVETVTLESIFYENQIQSCELLKIDCEGSEYAIFQNLSDKIFDKIQRIAIEIHPMEEQNPLELIKLIETKGYVVKGRELTNGCFEQFAVKKHI